MQISDINFQPLLSELYSKFEVPFQVDTSGKRPKLVHLDIMNQFGMLEMVAKDITVDFFNFGEMDGGGYWMNLYLWIYPKDGGVRGLEFMTAHVEDGGWRWMYNAPIQQL